MPQPALIPAGCAHAGAGCWACAHGWRGNQPAHVPASLCWHAVLLGGCYPLCEGCAARWRSYRDPARLHTL